MTLKCLKNCNLNSTPKIFKTRRIHSEITWDSIINEHYLLFKFKIDNEWFEKEASQCKVQLLSISLMKRITRLILCQRSEKENRDRLLRIQFQMWRVDWSNQRRINGLLILKFTKSLSRSCPIWNQAINEWTQTSTKQSKNSTIQRTILKQSPMRIESKTRNRRTRTYSS